MCVARYPWGRDLSTPVASAWRVSVASESPMDTPRTVLHALHDQAHQRQHRPALWTRRTKTYVPTSWHDYALRVRRFALGLHALGFKRGSTLPILASNREEWLVASLAAMSLGGVPVGVYTNSSLEQVQYVVNHCEARHVVVENEKFLAMVLAPRSAGGAAAARGGAGRARGLPGRGGEALRGRAAAGHRCRRGPVLRSPSTRSSPRCSPPSSTPRARPASPRG